MTGAAIPRTALTLIVLIQIKSARATRTICGGVDTGEAAAVALATQGGFEVGPGRAREALRVQSSRAGHARGVAREAIGKRNKIEKKQ